jgi:signal transduction histidine kinase
MADFDLLSSISHEFRTPLSTLNASIELLLQEADTLTPDDLRQLLRPTQVSLLSLQTLVNNLLESSRIEAGRTVLHRQSLHLGQVVAEAGRVVWPLLQRRRQQVSLELPLRLPAVDGDESRLIQVLVNLLTNAAKYSPAGALIDVAVRDEGAAVLVTVADRGPGIPPAQRDRLFDRFTRLDDATGDESGMGLGLFVAKCAIEAHGGQIGQEARPGGGAIFWFRLPRAASEVAP